MYQDESGYKGSKVGQNKEGFGILRNEAQIITYSGNWKDDQFHGEGTLFNTEPSMCGEDLNYHDINVIENNWIKYVGTFKNNQKHGDGTVTLSNATIFSGSWDEG
jgi:hypothetical protein